MNPSNEPLVRAGQGRDPESLIWSAWICGICFISGAAILACAIVNAAARRPEPAPSPEIHLPPPVVHVEPAAVTVENRVQSPAITVQASKVEPSIFIEPAPAAPTYVYATIEAPKPSVVLLTEQIPTQAAREILGSGDAAPVLSQADVERIAKRVMELDAPGRYGELLPPPKK